MNLDDIKSRFDCSSKINNVHRRTNKNVLLANWYRQLAVDIEFDSDISVFDYEDTRPYLSADKIDFWHRRIEDFEDLAKRVELCSRFWSGDYYRLQGVKDLTSVNLCHNRFCDNCQNTLAVQRSRKYSLVLDKLKEEFDIYHIVFTVPNVKVEMLESTINSMFHSFQKLIQYFSGRKKIKNIPFSQYGFVGAIRPLEVTKNHSTGEFHPHFHTLFLFKKGSKISSKKVYANQYSFNNADVKKSHKKGDNIRLFSSFEILLQKIWYLLMNNITVNYSNIDELPLGYSVIVENARGRYKEVFKYATKGLLSAEESKSATDVYEDFKSLFFTLYRRRLIQGYGILYNCKFERSVDLSADEIYLSIVKDLHFLEVPEAFNEEFKEIYHNVNNNKNITYISRSKIAEVMENDF